MDLIDKKNNQELHETILRELAKANSELRSADNDVKKAQNRMRFCIMIANRLIERGKD